MRSVLTRWGPFILFVVATTMPVAHAIPSTPNDPLFSLQWNMVAVGAPAAWQVGTGTGSTITIVNSGVNLDHEDLGSKIVGHVTCVGSKGDSDNCEDGGEDDNGHGTHVAGIAAAASDNGRGVAGVAPNASILDIKVLSQSCTFGNCDASGSVNDVIAGINYAVEHGATVINLSLGNTTQALLGHSFAGAVNDAFSKGVISVIAAGNDYLLPSHGSDVNAFVVGALNRDDGKATYANSVGDARWGLMAPGGESDTSEGCENHPAGVLSTYFMNRYACLAGTSMAAPHVAGAVAILRGLGYSPQDTVDRLLSTARFVGPTNVFGAGALDISAAVGAGPAEPPTTDTTAPDTDSSESDTSSSSSASTPPPAGDLGAPTSTIPPGIITLPNQFADGTASGHVIARTPSADDLAAGPVVVAVLMAATVGAASGWFLIRGSSWARRTPPL